MKKFWLLALVALMVLALVACGGNTETTPDKGGDTTPDATTTTKPDDGDVTPPADSTTEDGGNDVQPHYPGIDILNGDMDNAAVTPNWKGIDCIAFEDGHRQLDYRIALVFHMDETVNGIYEDLVYTTDATLPNDQNWQMNPEYRWEVTIDGEVIPINNFSLLNDQTSGYIRMDLGDWTYSTEVDEDGYHQYDCLLKIYDSSNEIAYWAWFTDPEWNGPYWFVIPDPIVMIEDPDRPATHVAIPDRGVAEGLAGPDGFNDAELYTNIFDDDVRSKLCTDFVVPIEWMYTDGAKSVVSYSLVGANDDESYSSRVPLKWTLYGCNDGTNWVKIDEQDLTAAGETVVNYGERNFVLDAPVEYQYFRFELDTTVHTSMWQMSDIVLYTEAE